MTEIIFLNVKMFVFQLENNLRIEKLTYTTSRCNKIIITVLFYSEKFINIFFTVFLPSDDRRFFIRSFWADRVNINCFLLNCFYFLLKGKSSKLISFDKSIASIKLHWEVFIKCLSIIKYLVVYQTAAYGFINFTL